MKVFLHLQWYYLAVQCSPSLIVGWVFRAIGAVCEASMHLNALGKNYIVLALRPKVQFQLQKATSCLEGRNILIWFENTSGTVGEGSNLLSCVNIVLKSRKHNLDDQARRRDVRSRRCASTKIQ